MIRCFYLILLFIVFLACRSEEKHKQLTPETSTHSQEEKSVKTEKYQTEILPPGFDTITVDNGFAYQLFKSENSGYGYRIFDNGKLTITQPHIPAVQGRKGFKTEESASKTAIYVIGKLKNNIFPPTITINELDSLDVLN